MFILLLGILATGASLWLYSVAKTSSQRMFAIGAAIVYGSPTVMMFVLVFNGTYHL